MTLISVIPLASLLFFMVILEWPAFKAAFLSLLITGATSLLFWHMPGNWIAASAVKGFLMAAEIMFILVGVLFMTEVLRKGRAFSVIYHLVYRISGDIRVQGIMLAWFLVSFIEGVAGFGTPSMIAAPLMVMLGFSPLTAVVTTLIGDGMSVTFGAAGVPLTIGIAQGLNSTQTALLGGGNLIHNVSIAAASFHFVLGSLLPFVIVCLISLIESGSFRKALAFWKFSLAAGLAMSIPYFLIAIFIGPELPTILGSIIGAGLVIIMARRRIFLPEQEWVFKESEETGSGVRAVHHTALFYFKSVIPYVLLISLLVFSRLNIFGFGRLLSGVRISFDHWLGSDLSFSFLPFYSPGTFFILAGLAGVFIYRMHWRQIFDVGGFVSKKAVKIFAALIFVLSIVQIMINSGHNSAGQVSMSMHLVGLLSETGVFWPVFSPIVGLFGAFVAGSSTVSNLMFASVQAQAAVALGFSPILALALQTIGSAVGNMIAVHNVLAASAVVHLKHAEGKVIKYNLLPALAYALAAGFIGFGFSMFFAGS